MASTTKHPTISAEVLAKAASVLKTLAHPLRIQVANLLRFEGEQTVSQICLALEAEQSLVSHHLASMKNGGVLSCRRDGKTILYSIAIPEVEKVLQCMETCEL